MDRIKIYFWRLAICAVLAGVWESLGRSSANAFFFIGSPSAVLSELLGLIASEGLMGHFLITGSEALLGMAVGTVVGASFGLVLWYSESITIVARPFIIGFGTLPVFAFAPLMIVWFGIGFGMKVALSAFSTVFVAFNQANKGATSVQASYIDTLSGMNAKRNQIFWKTVVPGSIDWVLSSMRLNVGFGLLGAFIGEFVASDVGLGFLILRAGGLYNIPRALAAAVGIVVLALLLDGLARHTERHSHQLVQWLSVPRILRGKPRVK
jgi:NitT/TauT family transport system permease protein